jgi:integrating conjugative element protein (TIGR03757 family)
MRTLRQFIFIAIFMASWCIAAEPIARSVSAPLPTNIEAFTTQDDRPTQAPSQNLAEVRVLVLDGIRELEATLSDGLPLDPAMAEREVLKRLRRLEGDWHARVKSSAEALMRAQELGVERHPAIVFDERWVVYGLTDLGAAIAHYRRWHGGQGT